MQNLPQPFLDKMRDLLGVEYGAFLASYDCPRHFGLRVNTLKISPREFERLAPFHLTRIPWTENGYYYEEQDAPARHPLYYAGLYYLQEPSAMTPASVLPVRPGERVLDLCAAPGGKATELGAKLRGRGVLVANDISASRAKALLKNIEVFGISNAFVTNETPARLAGQFPEFFDKILVDAPCSGEGMFRKDPSVARAWDEEKPIACAKQQREIIRRAADMLAPGGQMLYSTCTFSPEENEQIIAGLLREREDMKLLDIPWQEGFAKGIPKAAKPDWRGRPAGTDSSAGLLRELEKCVRIFPHKMAGEGHFLALLQKRAEDDKPAGGRREGARQPSGRPQRAGGNSFGGRSSAQGDILRGFLKNVSAPAEENRLEIRKGQAYYVPELPGEGKGLSFLRNGLYLGEVKKDRFEPSQSLAMALKKEQYGLTVDLKCGDERVFKYLKGETVDAGDLAFGGAKGWALVCADGFPLGWGKLADGTLKNKYHPGWRMR